MVDIAPVQGTAPGERDKKFFVAFYQQWSSFLHPLSGNWLDFTVIKLQGEYARYSGRWELEIGIVGLQWTFTYVFDQSFNEEMSDLKSRIEADLKGRTGAKEIVDPFGALDKLNSNS